MKLHLHLSSVVITLIFLSLSYQVEAQSKKTSSSKKAELIENGVISAEKFGLKPGETKARQTKALQAIVDFYADNVPHNSWDINLQNPEPTIIIPAGEYNVGEIELRSYVTIRGAGRGSTILKGTTFKADKQFNITIEDLSVVGYVGATKKSNYCLNNTSHSSAFKLRNCARIIFKNVCVKNYDVAIDNFNTYLLDLYSCFISYCNVCYMNDGNGSGLGGHSIRWFGGEMYSSAYGFVQKEGSSVLIMGATIENCRYGFFMINPSSFVINACSFEANNYDIYGALTHISVENNYFSKSGKKEGDAYLYATGAIGFALIQGNTFDLPVFGRPHIFIEDTTTVYSNILIGQNNIIYGGRIPVSERLLPYVNERGVNKYIDYLPNGGDLIMGQTIIYKNSQTGKYYIVTRNTEGDLLYSPLEKDLK